MHCDAFSTKIHSKTHLEMLVQFGYVTLFSSAFPMAAMCALLNNVIEIRSDAFKLCMSFQRPFGQQVQSIGTWQVIKYILECVHYAGSYSPYTCKTHNLYNKWCIINDIYFVIEHDLFLQDALEFMSVIAVMVNCALVGFSGLADRLFPDMTHC